MALTGKGRGEPDYTRLVRVLTGSGPPDRLPFIDLRVDDAIVEQICEETFEDKGSTAATEAHRADLLVRCCLHLNFDMVWARVSVPFRRAELRAQDTAGGGVRGWLDTHGSGVTTREAYETYPWPEPGDINLPHIEALESRAPEGMGIFSTTSGVYENATRLMGVEGLAYAMVDAPDLVADVFRSVGERVLAHVEALARLDCIQACWMGDDLGHKTGLLVPPDFLREHVFPWIRRCAEAVHSRGKPFVLHSCGNVRSIFEDLIDLGIDAKHSFEDNILPVDEAMRLYGDRVSLVGGIDVHLLAQGSEEQIRRRTREVIEACAPSGRWALGSGNSFANYIPIPSYLAMLDEGRKTWPL